ncbi:MAG: L-histidine N(alpha)-methyltransferase [Gammaproteobacteria bacterium]|jgi:dimethylhistidine N-methyltransferase
MNNNEENTAVELHDYHPSRADLKSDILGGLRQPRKWISSMYFYDERGSQLFDRICEQPEYYPTRTELAIMEADVDAMCDLLGEHVLLVEPGSGSSLKTRILLAHMHKPAGYVPVEISRDYLMQSVEALQEAFPTIEILPVCADFTSAFELPSPEVAAARNVVYFPGSTIGNFEPDDALDLLANMRRLAADNGALLVGVDLRKEVAVMEAAYNDAAGVTAEFNLNVLARLNRDLKADFDLSAFRHRAIWNDEESRIEMHLVSSRDQEAHIAGETFHFAEGEYIHTESSYKYTPERFAALAARAGFRVKRIWTDDRRWFSVQYLESV